MEMRVIELRSQYNSFDYWKEAISKSRTIRGHIFVNETITKKTVYFHSLIFCKNSGVENLWAPFPNVKALLGYVQHSFLQEAFYKWIYSREQKVSFIPYKTTEEIINKALDDKKITREEADKMRRHIGILNKCWNLEDNRIIIELKKFAIDFNRTWLGDNTEFLYVKVFAKAEDLGEFVVDSNRLIDSENKIEAKIGMNVDNFIKTCKMASLNKTSGEELKKILVKRLTEII